MTKEVSSPVQSKVEEKDQLSSLLMSTVFKDRFPFDNLVRNVLPRPIPTRLIDVKECESFHLDQECVDLLSHSVETEFQALQFHDLPRHPIFVSKKPTVSESDLATLLCKLELKNQIIDLSSVDVPHLKSKTQGSHKRKLDPCVKESYVVKRAPLANSSLPSPKTPMRISESHSQQLFSMVSDICNEFDGIADCDQPLHFVVTEECHVLNATSLELLWQCLKGDQSNNSLPDNLIVQLCRIIDSTLENHKNGLNFTSTAALLKFLQLDISNPVRSVDVLMGVIRSWRVSLDNLSELRNDQVDSMPQSLAQMEENLILYTQLLQKFPMYVRDELAIPSIYFALDLVTRYIPQMPESKSNSLRVFKAVCRSLCVSSVRLFSLILSLDVGNAPVYFHETVQYLCSLQSCKDSSESFSLSSIVACSVGSPYGIQASLYDKHLCCVLVTDQTYVHAGSLFMLSFFQNILVDSSSEDADKLLVKCLYQLLSFGLKDSQDEVPTKQLVIQHRAVVEGLLTDCLRLSMKNDGIVAPMVIVMFVNLLIQIVSEQSLNRKLSTSDYGWCLQLIVSIVQQMRGRATADPPQSLDQTEDVLDNLLEFLNQRLCDHFSLYMDDKDSLLSFFCEVVKKEATIYGTTWEVILKRGSNIDEISTFDIALSAIKADQRTFNLLINLIDAENTQLAVKAYRCMIRLKFDQQPQEALSRLSLSLATHIRHQVTSIRECSIDCIKMMVSQVEIKLMLQFLQDVCLRTQDTSVSVRKKALMLLREYCAKFSSTPPHQLQIDTYMVVIGQQLLRRAALEEDPALKRLVVESVLQIFVPEDVEIIKSTSIQGLLANELSINITELSVMERQSFEQSLLLLQQILASSNYLQFFESLLSYVKKDLEGCQPVSELVVFFALAIEYLFQHSDSGPLQMEILTQLSQWYPQMFCAHFQLIVDRMLSALNNARVLKTVWGKYLLTKFGQIFCFVLELFRDLVSGNIAAIGECIIDLSLISQLEPLLLSCVLDQSTSVATQSLKCLVKIAQCVSSNFALLTVLLEKCLNFVSQLTQVQLQANWQYASAALNVCSILISEVDIKSLQGENCGLSPNLLVDTALAQHFISLLCKVLGMVQSADYMPHLLQVCGPVIKKYPMMLAHDQLSEILKDTLNTDSQTLSSSPTRALCVYSALSLLDIFFKANTSEFPEGKQASKYKFEILLGQSKTQEQSSVVVHVAQSYLLAINQLVLCSVVDIHMMSFRVLADIIKSQCVQPLQVMPPVIATLCSDSSMSGLASTLHANLVKKHESFIHKRNGDGIKMSFTLRVDLKQNLVGYTQVYNFTYVSALQSLSSNIASDKTARVDFAQTLSHLVSSLALTSKPSMVDLQYANYLCNAIASLDFKHIAEVLTILSSLQSLFAESLLDAETYQGSLISQQEYCQCIIWTCILNLDYNMKMAYGITKDKLASFSLGQKASSSKSLKRDDNYRIVQVDELMVLNQDVNDDLKAKAIQAFQRSYDLLSNSDVSVQQQKRKSRLSHSSNTSDTYDSSNTSSSEKNSSRIAQESQGKKKRRVKKKVKRNESVQSDAENVGVNVNIATSPSANRPPPSSSRRKSARKSSKVNYLESSTTEYSAHDQDSSDFE
ncbi:hypothetical protein MIR68_010253 [Amoeboaphelidium protococcarum]|nr:hypothetical protein MIR68_010253 [Amoeboaphelidium protococcarum]